MKQSLWNRTPSCNIFNGELPYSTVRLFLSRKLLLALLKSHLPISHAALSRGSTTSCERLTATGDAGENSTHAALGFTRDVYSLHCSFLCCTNDCTSGDSSLILDSAPHTTISTAATDSVQLGKGLEEAYAHCKEMKTEAAAALEIYCILYDSTFMRYLATGVGREHALIRSSVPPHPNPPLHFLQRAGKCQNEVDNSFNVHFWTVEERCRFPQETGENLCRNGMNMQTPHRKDFAQASKCKP